MARKNGACNIDTRVKDTIAELREHGIAPKKIMELTRQSRSLVGFVVRSAKLAQEGDIEDAIHVAQKKMDLNMDARFTELIKKLDKLSTIIQSCCKGIECKIESVSDCQDDQDDEADGHENWY